MMMSNNTAQAPRCNLNFPVLLFGGAFVVAAIMGATSETPSAFANNFTDEVKVVQGETAVAFDEIDLIANCETSDKTSSAEECEVASASAH